MLASNGEEYVRIFYVSANHLHLIELEDDEFGMVRIPKDTCLIPDLSDPATCGAMLALVREAWTQEPGVNHWVNYAVPVFDGLETWRVGCIIDGAKMFAVCDMATMALVEGKTEAEALVAALEAAP
jgi:hypothetical protein